MESQQPSVKLPGTVAKIIQFPYPGEPEKAQIAIEGADDLFSEIRIENTLNDKNGDKVSLQPGAPVQVTIEAERAGTIVKS